MAFGIEGQDNTIGVSENSDFNNLKTQVENLGLKGNEKVHLISGKSGMETLFMFRNLVMRPEEFDDLSDGFDFTLPFDVEDAEVEVGQEREEHEDEDKDWFYHHEAKVTLHLDLEEDEEE